MIPLDLVQALAEAEALLDHYRLRHAHHMQNAAYLERELKARDQELAELRKRLKGGGL